MEIQENPNFEMRCAEQATSDIANDSNKIFVAYSK